MLIKYSVLCVFVRMLIFRTEMLLIFIMYQHDMKLSLHEVHRDEFRNVEKIVFKKFNREICFGMSLFGIALLCSVLALIFNLED